MTRNLKQSKVPQCLTHSLQRRLTSYAVAAGAAGVGTLALAVPWEAVVGYTPAHLVIRPQFDSPGAGYPLDLNGDGLADFQIVNSTFGHGGGALVAPAAHGNLVIGAGIYASALTLGASIGPAGPFAHRAQHATSMARWIDSSGFIYSYGPWKDTLNRYLGFKLVINGEVHFGWARLSIDRNSMFLSGYAYETVANQTIKAGQQAGADEAANIQPAERHGAATNVGATLGTLALGSAGLVAWRKETV